jgi:hypothetical protein
MAAGGETSALRLAGLAATGHYRDDCEPVVPVADAVGYDGGVTWEGSAMFRRCWWALGAAVVLLVGSGVAWIASWPDSGSRIRLGMTKAEVEAAVAPGYLEVADGWGGPESEFAVYRRPDGELAVNLRDGRVIESRFRPNKNSLCAPSAIGSAGDPMHCASAQRIARASCVAKPCMTR